MGGQFVKMLKFGLLVVIAFAVPKMITESGHYFKNLEQIDNDSQNSKTKAIDSDNQSQPITKWKQFFTETSQNSDHKTVVAKSFLDPQKDSIYDKRTEIVYKSPIIPIEEMVRFDRNPNWIINSWSRVDTIQSAPPFFGYRVAALTGSQKDDLAGVLTYYFDERQMRQITFIGKTGDYSKILTFLQRYFGMVRLEKESTANQYVYEATLREENSRKKSQNIPKSRLLIRPTQTFLAEDPNGRFEIEFQLNSP